jgi:hypothetical protein
VQYPQGSLFQRHLSPQPHSITTGKLLAEVLKPEEEFGFWVAKKVFGKRVSLLPPLRAMPQGEVASKSR